jgi:hypothetical protein
VQAMSEDLVRCRMCRRRCYAPLPGTFRIVPGRNTAR